MGDDLITQEHLDRLVENLHVEDSILVSELATTLWDMPIEATLQALEERVDRGLINAKLVSISGAKVLVTPRYEETQRCRIRGAFRAITLPTQVRPSCNVQQSLFRDLQNTAYVLCHTKLFPSLYSLQVDSVCHEFQWDVAHVLPIIQDLCTTGEVNGEVHQSGGASFTGAMFLPSVYLAMQRTSIDEFFAANGFITSHDCLERGVLESKMGEYVLESNVSKHCQRAKHDVVQDAFRLS